MKTQLFSTLKNQNALKNTLLMLLVLVVIPVVLVFSNHLILCQGFSKTCLWFAGMWKIALLEITLISIISAVFYGIFSKLWLCNLCIAIPYILLTLISYYKSVINGTPLLLGDFKMAGQFLEIAGFALPQVRFSIYTYMGIIIPLLLSVALFIWDKTLKSLLVRKVMAAISIVFVGMFAFTHIFSHWAVAVDDSNKFQDQRVSDYGPFMGLYCTYAQGIRAGEIYNQESILKVKKQVEELLPVASESEKTPTVIFLMSESFFDVAKLDNVEFKPDPIPNFHKISQKYQSGNFISSAYCGGTGYVEMEVLTGICSNLLKSGDTLTYLNGEDTYKKLPSITDVFKNYGYKTVFLHSYNSQLYNRAKIYKDFGFDKVLFEDSFEKPEYKGGYISDMELAEKIISLYEEKKDDKLFLYAVSMENHQPYTRDKFEKSPVKIKTENLSSEEIEIFDAYITGLADADKSLGRLVNYFSKKKEPVMLVFFGDHLPNLMLNEEDSVFTKLGYVDGADSTKWGSSQLKKMLSTDYVIWTNYKDNDYINETQGSNFLGVSVLDRLGLKLTDYYNWLKNRIVPELLMYRSRLFVDENGTDFEKVYASDKEMIDDYAVAIYDIIYGDNRIFPAGR